MLIKANIIDGGFKMTNDSLTLYKLIILYMLNKVNFPLTNTQISNFILDKGYTTYFTIQHAINDLLESDLIEVRTYHNSSQYHITKSGRETLSFFKSKISDAIIADIDQYLIENKYELRNEVNTISEYYKSTNNDFTVHLAVKEAGSPLIDLHLSVPTEAQADAMCVNWKEESQTIYAFVMDKLMK